MELLDRPEEELLDEELLLDDELDELLLDDELLDDELLDEEELELLDEELLLGSSVVPPQPARTRLMAKDAAVNAAFTFMVLSRNYCLLVCCSNKTCPRW